MKLFYDIDPNHSTVLKLQELLDQELAPYPDAVFWPAASDEIPDDSLLFRVAYLPLSFCKQPARALERELNKLHREWARTRRQYRNAVAFAVPDVTWVDHTLDLIQKNGGARVVSADLSRIYPALMLPMPGDGFQSDTSFRELTIESGEIGLNLHERVRRMLDKICDNAIEPQEIIEIMGLGRTDEAGIKRILFPLVDVVRWFFVFLGLPRFRDATPIWDAVAKGIEKGSFGVLFDADHLPLDELSDFHRMRVSIGISVDSEQLASTFGYIVWKGALG